MRRVMSTYNFIVGSQIVELRARPVTEEKPEYEEEDSDEEDL
jgi:hypothetical protein